MSLNFGFVGGGFRATEPSALVASCAARRWSEDPCRGLTGRAPRPTLACSSSGGALTTSRARAVVYFFAASDVLSERGRDRQRVIRV